MLSNHGILGTNGLLDSDIKTFSESRITLNTIKNVYFIVVARIIRCEASSNYTSIIQLGERNILVSHTLKDIEKALKNPMFLRIHRSHLININFIKYYDKLESVIIMHDNSKIPVSTRRKIIIRNLLKLMPTP